VTAPAAPPPRILALIPGYEEGPRIGAVVEAASRHLPVLVVDDGSSDDTAIRAEAAGATVIRQVPNQGKGAALRAGFRRALEEGWDAVLTLDADGQHDPTEIPRFVAAFTAPGAHGPRPELIVGRRDFSRMPPVRRLSNTLGTALFSWAVGRHIPDNQSGYRLLGRRLMSATLDSRETGFEFEVEMIAVCLRQGWTLDWVPISTIYAGQPSHVKPLAHLRHFVRATLAARRTLREQVRPGE
jgi:glycosyltransferase involved in cell wall biosynthesis